MLVSGRQLTPVGRRALVDCELRTQRLARKSGLVNRVRTEGRQRVAVARSAGEEAAPAPSTAAAPEPAIVPQPASASSSTATATSAPQKEEEPEVVFYEGPGSNAELAFSLLMLPTLIYAPLSMASIGRRLWISFRFTNKRLVIQNTSPLFKRNIEVSYRNVKEVRTGPRGFGMWGDMVVFLRDGSRLELSGLEKYKEIEEHINRCIFTL